MCTYSPQPKIGASIRPNQLHAKYFGWKKSCLIPLFAIIFHMNLDQFAVYFEPTTLVGG